MFDETVINIGNVKINSASGNSRVHITKTMQLRNFASIKKNQGFGEQNADGVVMVNPANGADDRDITDTEAVHVRRC